MLRPASMRAIQILQPGPHSRLEMQDVPLPTPGPGELLIKTVYAGVNRADLFQRQGNYAPPPGASPILGLEVSGTITAVGEGVTSWNIGDEVCALLTGGGYADYCNAPAGQVLPVPTGLSLKEAAALPEACFTVWMTLFEDAKLQPGERLLVHGGASGIGTTAIQMARLKGAEVYATAGTTEKCEFCHKLGAARAINYKTEDFVTILKDETGGEGVHVILDMTGGDNIAKNMQALAVGGRMVSIAFLRGNRQEISMGPLLMKRLHWIGSTLRARSAAEKAAMAAKLRAEIWPLIAQNALFPVLDSEFSLPEAEKAHQRMEQNLNIGKIVLKV